MAASAGQQPVFEEREQQRREDHDGDIETDKLELDPQRPDERRYAKNDSQVEHVRSQNIPHGNALLALQRGLDDHEQFGRAGAERDHREADYKRAQAQTPGQRSTPPNEGLGPEKQGRKSKGNPERCEHHAAADSEVSAYP